MKKPKKDVYWTFNCDELSEQSKKDYDETYQKAIENLARGFQEDIDTQIMYELVKQQAKEIAKQCQEDGTDLPDWVVDFLTEEI